MGVYWNNNGKNGNSTIDIEDSFIISYVKKWIYSKGDTLMNADVEFLSRLRAIGSFITKPGIF